MAKHLANDSVNFLSGKGWNDLNAKLGASGKARQNYVRRGMSLPKETIVFENQTGEELEEYDVVHLTGTLDTPTDTEETRTEIYIGVKPFAPPGNAMIGIVQNAVSDGALGYVKISGRAWTRMDFSGGIPNVGRAQIIPGDWTMLRPSASGTYVLSAGPATGAGELVVVDLTGSWHAAAAVFETPSGGIAQNNKASCELQSILGTGAPPVTYSGTGIFEDIWNSAGTVDENEIIQARTIFNGMWFATVENC